MKVPLIMFAVILGVACITPASRSSTPASPAVPSVTSPPDADDVVTRTNAERAKLRLYAFAKSPVLMKAAQIHAEQMAAAKKMAHELPSAAFPSPPSRLKAVGYRASASGENVAEGFSSASTVVAGWMTSPGHRANIVSDKYLEMGAGVAVGSNGRRYYAQVFGRP